MISTASFAFQSLIPTQSSSLPRRKRGRIGVVRSMSSSLSTAVQTLEGNGGIPMVKLTSTTSTAEVYLFGACVTSWKPSNDRDLLFVRPDAVFNGTKPISGGIPHCFPQFGPGAMQQHGFARNMNWSVVDSKDSQEEPTVTFELKDTPYSRSMWDFSFHALYKVALNSNSLSTTLTVKNTDDKAFSFNSALHTYFSAAVSSATVKGLKNCKTLNKDPDPSNPIEGREERDIINYPGFVDCIYLDAPSEVCLDNGLGDIITIQNKSWSDVVLWNPHLQMESCYKDFVCVENAKIGKVELQSNETWIAEQCISVS
ncbi:putative Aldose 1-epimerase [Zostera marina]|uniref:glucose-6-phosphate 1-epimerase n=1 Tax=Zostera marina TaxID=29655 RepID=A0A0K9Q1P8_ZOSMR|nr:putative Aldose 1-epimerase [Zostera marina]